MRVLTFPRKWKQFILHIILPAVLAEALFVLAIFQILIPSMEQQLLNRKQETIRELTWAAWSILDEYHREELAGSLTRQEAQREAATRIQFLRYGEEGKDYFWITDMHPSMVMHPYRPDLNGQDLAEVEDLGGKKMFVAFIDAVRENEAGYVDYYWQWKDDAQKIVPKLSYVRAFRPWQWVVGTGIYIEDVKEEIALVERRLTLISLGITAAVALLLFYIARNSLEMERQRAEADQGLQESNEKYRLLVEAATEGTLLILSGRCAYSNKTLLDMLGYAAEELPALAVTDLFARETGEDQQAAATIQSWLQGEAAPVQFEARLLRKDGHPLEVLLAATRVSFAEQDGIILVARDVSRHKEMKAALDQTRHQFKTMTNAISLGVFRSAWGRKAILLEANPAVRRIFGLPPEADLGSFDWLARIPDPDERTALIAKLTQKEVLENHPVRLLRGDGRMIEAALFAVLFKDENGFPLYCDGILEDVTEQKRAEAERDELIARLQTSLFFLQEPVTRALEPAVTCGMNQPVSRAASLMTHKGVGAVLVAGPSGELVGIVTDHDFQERVVAAGCDPQRPVHEIMSAPIISISDHALVYEAILLMQAKGISHLAVKDEPGTLKGTVHFRDLIDYRQYSSVSLTNTIRRAHSLEEIVTAHTALPRLVKALIDSGAKVRQINRIIASVSDVIVERLLEMAVEQLGPPPARFAFLALGSEGRQEQTLLTDQDNAIIYEDPPPGKEVETGKYFLDLGHRVCDWLDQVGYASCPGGVMAKNPRWNQPLSAWKDCFQEWIHNANPQELLELNMLFDFRCVSGERSLGQDLRTWVFDAVASCPPFFLHFAQNALTYKPPLGFFGNILIETSEEGPKALNLKEAMLPVVNYARLYALKHRIEETHTLDRLTRLHALGLLSREGFEELIPAYEAMMRMRLDRQAVALQEHQKPSNWISRQEWTPLEEAVLKRAFSIVSNLRKKISYDFLGMA